MSTDEAYLEKQAKAEEEKLQKKIQALSDSDKKEIYEKGNHRFVCLFAWRSGHESFQTFLKELCLSSGQVWSCCPLRVKLRTSPVCLLSKCPTSSPRYRSLLFRSALQVQHSVR